MKIEYNCVESMVMCCGTCLLSDLYVHTYLLRQSSESDTTSTLTILNEMDTSHEYAFCLILIIVACFLVDNKDGVNKMHEEEITCTQLEFYSSF